MPKLTCSLPSRSRGSSLIIVLTIVILAILGLASMYARAPSAPRVETGDVEEKTNALIQPVAKVELAAAPTVAPGSQTGEQVVASVCGGCHNTGAAGAPKVGDNAAWAPRIAQGLDGLLKSAINGKNAMPPKGGKADLTDAELTRAIVFMTGKSGGSFKEPK